MNYKSLKHAISVTHCKNHYKAEVDQIVKWKNIGKKFFLNIQAPIMS